MIKNLQKFLSLLLILPTLVFGLPKTASAFPIYAQQAYENPREANGRIVCANCHLAQKPSEIEAPGSVLPNSVFEAVVKIPYDQQIKQVLNFKTTPETVDSIINNEKLLDLARRPVMIDLIIEALPYIEAGKPVDIS
jgi:apocytochrome f